MSSLFFDLQKGISGDMGVAALLSLTGQEEKVTNDLREKLRTLSLSGYDIEVKQEQRNGLLGTLFTVHTDGQEKVLRNFNAIHELIARSGLLEGEKNLAISIFETLARAEAAVHGTTPDKVHFHEIGAVDSIVDIVSFSVLYAQLHPDRACASSVALGSGTTLSMHGEIPVPAPATLEILKGVPVYGTDKSCELTTPTGAAIVRTVVTHFGPLPHGVVQKTGLGFGHRTSPSFNGLRVLEIAEVPQMGNDEGGTVGVIEVTIDDSTPEEIAFLHELLLSEGALDVWVTPVHMKKNRPGFNITVLCSPGSLEGLAQRVLRKSSTFGLRYSFQERKCLRRSIKEVRTEYGPVHVKLGMLGDEVVKVVPEYKDCRNAAMRHDIPIERVFAAAKAEAVQQLREGKP